MPVISIVNQKGGTGKTTTTLNLGAALADRGKSVLICDMDSQGNLGYSLGLSGAGGTMADVLAGEVRVEDAIEEKEKMHIVSSDLKLVDLELSLGDDDNRHQVLHQCLGEITDQYDYVLIDCPPSLSILALNSLYASDHVIIPMLMEVLSLQGLEQIIKTIEKVNNAFDKEISVLGVLPVMVDRRRKLTEEVRNYIDENYELNIFESMIRNNVKASEAPSFGQSVVHYAPKSNSAKDYIAFSKELAKLV